MVIVFDLDETLFDSETFAYGGFEAVSHFLSPLLHVKPSQIHEELFQLFLADRTQIFDRYLKQKGVYTKRLLNSCVSVYRKHNPKIKLFPEADACLERLKKFPLYVVTDGNKLVQKNKCIALGLPSRVKKYLCTYAYGVKHTKPSPYCFLRICEWEKVPPSQVVYIADNPTKDFVGIKPLGFRTIRVLSGHYQTVKVDSTYEAECIVSSLDEIDEALLKRLQ